MIRQGDFLTSVWPVIDGDFDLILIDPPYGNTGYDFGTSKDSMPVHEWRDWLMEVLELCEGVLKPGGCVYMYGFPEWLCRIAAQFPPENQRWLCWYYRNRTALGSKFWQKSHESILMLWFGGRPMLHYNDIRTPYTESSKKMAAKGQQVRSGSTGRYGSKRSMYKFHPDGALPRDVIEVPILSAGAGYRERHVYCKTCGGIYREGEKKAHEKHETIQHPTQKPMQLTELLIKSVIKAGDGSVLIPFAGSGSECVVAEKLGCDWLATELNPEYVMFAEAWLDKEAGEWAI